MIFGRFASLLLLALFAAGCASTRSLSIAEGQPFNFEQDTFAFANELVWEYKYDENGKWTTKPRKPKPDYTLRCFVVARSALQFNKFARFDPEQPVAQEREYRRLISRIVSKNPRRRNVKESDLVVVPGYANLREFSVAQEQLLKAECGGAWQSYLQRGHWRMIFPFNRRHQEETAETLAEAVAGNTPRVVHVLRFPDLTINHALLLYDARETPKGTEFCVYDPNYPAKPSTLVYDASKRSFSFPPNTYFRGGKVKVYQVYHHWLY